jgi:hypothetical protein
MTTLVPDVLLRAHRPLLESAQWFQRCSHLYLYGGIHASLQAMGLYDRADGMDVCPVSAYRLIATPWPENLGAR